jgi:parvulin-like peptidyl-prolyl isomerase
MLKTMRDNAKYFYVLFFIVILSFIFWGVGTMDKTDTRDILAEVGSYKITAQEYWRAYDNAFKFYRELYKDKFDEDMQSKLNLKDNVLNALIDNRLLLVAAKDNGITVSDEELNDAIRHEPAFAKNGVFDPYVYENRLRLERITPEEYEAATRQELAVRKIRRLIELSASAPDEDAAKAAAQQLGQQNNPQTVQDALMSNAREAAVKAYLEGLRKEVKVKIFKERIA